MNKDGIGRKLGDFFFNRPTTETYEELNKVFVLFVTVLSFAGLYMYKLLMTTEAGQCQSCLPMSLASSQLRSFLDVVSYMFFYCCV